MSTHPPKYTNALIEEASPYLQQHAHNPVNWMPWGDEAFNKAKEENKLVLISIGYSACHWCHVMEHESFEDTAIARIMNENFVCIKVDREERPDVDEIYMTAVQIMTQQGGWPLNCFALPNGQPVYGGTYFRPDQWTQVLQQLSDMYQKEPEKVREYGVQLSDAVKENSLIKLPKVNSKVSKEWLQQHLEQISKSFDQKNGGQTGAPKFPMPVVWDFILEYGSITNDQGLLQQLDLTLEKLAMGGIYDQIGGGFARYSVDDHWKVPHFEKMLYDNAQLIGLYARAYRRNPNPLYKKVVAESIAWLRTDMLSPQGGFYAALDADSEGEEGKYYVWTPEAMKDVLTKEEFELAKAYFNLNPKGYWEHGNYIPLLDEGSVRTWKGNTAEIEKIQKKLCEVRAKRIAPGLDDKQLTSWNALTALGLLEAYVSFQEPEYKQHAFDCLDFIKVNCWKDGALLHYYKKGGRQDVDFSEDYAYTIQALLKAFEITQQESYILWAKELLEQAVNKFENANGVFSDRPEGADNTLISEHYSVTDNVTPSVNGILTQCQYKLGAIFLSTDWMEKAKHRALQFMPQIKSYPTGYTSWLKLLAWNVLGFKEVVVSGPNADKYRQILLNSKAYNVLIMSPNKNIALLQNKQAQTDLFFICENTVCKKPNTDFEKVLEELTEPEN